MTLRLALKFSSRAFGTGPFSAVLSLQMFHSSVVVLDHAQSSYRFGIMCDSAVKTCVAVFMVIRLTVLAIDREGDWTADAGLDGSGSFFSFLRSFFLLGSDRAVVASVVAV